VGSRAGAVSLAVWRPASSRGLSAGVAMSSKSGTAPARGRSVGNQRRDLAADGRRCQVQLGGGPREGDLPRACLEAAQRAKSDRPLPSRGGQEAHGRIMHAPDASIDCRLFVCGWPIGPIQCRHRRSHRLRSTTWEKPMGLATVTTTRTIDLGRDEQVSMDALRGRIEVAHGCTWLTVAGDARDTFLAAGDGWRLSGRPVMLGTSAAARVRLVDGIAAEGSALVRGWQRLLCATRRQVQRLQFGPADVQPWT
jgi:hypothetical protein